MPDHPKTNRLAKGGAVAALAVSIVGGAEGLRQTAYPDPATRGPPWTICYGHAAGVKPWMHDSIEQCKALLLADLNGAANGIERCIPSIVRAPDTRYVAVLSLAHNIGVGGVCKSSVARDLNAGEVQRACDDFLKFNRAAGIVWPGLTRRRAQERSLCLDGVNQ
jgi:lysozyme